MLVLDNGERNAWQNDSEVAASRNRSGGNEELIFVGSFFYYSVVEALAASKYRKSMMLRYHTLLMKTRF